MEEKEMVGSLLSAANWPIVGQICWVLGKVMNFIYTKLFFRVFIKLHRNSVLLVFRTQFTVF